MRDVVEEESHHPPEYGELDAENGAGYPDENPDKQAAQSLDPDIFPDLLIDVYQEERKLPLFSRRKCRY